MMLTASRKAMVMPRLAHPHRAHFRCKPIVIPPVTVSFGSPPEPSPPRRSRAYGYDAPARCDRGCF